MSHELHKLTQNVVAYFEWLQGPETQLCDIGIYLSPVHCLCQTIVLLLCYCRLTVDASLTNLKERGKQLVQTLSESLDKRLEQSLLSVLKKGVAASMAERKTCLWTNRDKV